jgi:ribosome modulation factor
MSRSSRRLDAFERAEIKGRDAYLNGESERDCPYEDKRTGQGKLTFSMGFINAWLRGFRRASRRLEENHD